MSFLFIVWGTQKIWSLEEIQGPIHCKILLHVRSFYNVFQKNWQKIKFLAFIMVEIIHRIWPYLIALAQFGQLLLVLVFYSCRVEVPLFTYM